MDVVIPELPASRRFRAVGFPTALPGNCYTCRTHEGPFIDTGIQEDMYGAIYLCLKCITEMAHEFGFTTPEESDLLKQKIKGLESTVNEFSDSNERLIEENHGLRMAVASSVNHHDVRDAGSDSSNDEDIEQSDSQSGEAKSEDFDLFGGESKGHPEQGSD